MKTPRWTKRYRFVFSALTLIVWAAAPAVKAAEADWLSKDEVAALIAKLPPSPEPGSTRDLADLELEIYMQEHRTHDRSAQAVVDSGYSTALAVKDIDPRITPDRNPAFFRFFARLHREANLVDGEAKDVWKRPRPFEGHPDVVHPLFTAKGYSYPSGHATMALCDAVILNQLFPSKSALILTNAKRIAQSRVIAGVHYESDVDEGEGLGMDIAGDLLNKPQFLAELSDLKTEVQAQEPPSGKQNR